MAKSPPGGSSELGEKLELEAAGSAAARIARRAVTYIRYEESRPAAIRAMLAGPRGSRGER